MTDSAQSAPARVQWLGALLVVLAGAGALSPVLGNGFLYVAFDDPGFVTEVETIGPWTWQRLWMCFDRFYLYDYVPLPMVSFLLEYQLWGLDPLGYHATNLLFHVLNAVLVQRWVSRTLDSAVAGVLAGVVFAVHPVQVEAVAIVAQRKTLLAAFFLLLALLAYGRYKAGGSSVWNGAGLVAFAAACLSKSSVVPFPLLLFLYDWLRTERCEWRSKWGYFVLAAATALLSAYAKMGVVVQAPHGESVWVSALVVGQVWWEYLVALFAPAGLAPAYYYQRSQIGSPLNYVSLLGLLVLALSVWRMRQRMRRTAFTLAWIGLCLLPVSNIVPIAVLRADRYLYLPMIAFSLWVGALLACARLREGGKRWALGTALALWCTALAWQSHAYAAVFRDDVTARGRAVERHPWAAPAHYLLALAWIQRGDWQQAHAAAQAALQRDPQFSRAQELLARLEAADPVLRPAGETGNAEAGK
ncbi:MAG: hypothetical protein N3C12_06575 [Candidatus Binatia bacterium]|nr:hypothetical protein [Candidatus Binatia bacterium]